MSKAMKMDPAAMDNEKLVDANYVAEMFGASRTWVNERIKEGDIPAPMRIGGLLRWRVGELREWMNAGCPAVRGVEVEHDIQGESGGAA